MYNRDKIIKTLKEIEEESKSIKPYVLVAQPRRDSKEIAAQNLDGYTGLHINFNAFSHGYCTITGEMVDVARNYLFEAALLSGAKYLFFVGDDTICPYDGFIKLHEIAEKNPDAMVAGVYYIKLSVPMIMIKKDDYIIPANVDPGQVFEAWQTGLDCALIPIDIIRKIKEDDPEIPFCCIGGEDQGVPFIGEDNFFVYRLRKLGYRLLVNTDVQCLHCDLQLHKFTAHPDITPEQIKQNYFTNFPLEGRLTWEDKEIIDKRWVETLPKQKEKE